MKLSTRIKQPARPDSRRFLSLYLEEVIDYGGIPCTRAEAIVDMQSMGLTQPEIDRWLQGQELAQRLRERHLRFRLYVEANPKLARRKPGFSRNT